MENLIEDYEGFVTHVRKWDEVGIPWGLSDLIELSIKYNTPIPQETIDYRNQNKI